MSQLHEKIRSLNNSEHEQVKETLAQFFQKLSRTGDTDHTQWLDSLLVILTRFPKLCVPHRNAIETYLTQFLNSDNDCWVIAAAKCCHSVQQIKPSNERTATAKSSWRQQMSLLCAAAHNLVGAAFSDAVDIYKSAGYFQKAESVDVAQNSPIGAVLSDITSFTTQFGRKNNTSYVTLSPVQKNSLLCRRLKNVMTFLQAMLVEVYPVAKPVRPQTILDVIVRALSITSGSKQTPIKEADKETMSANIALVKTQALRTLDALIICLGSNLIPYSPLLFRLATQTLRWSSSNSTQEARDVRRACYSTVSMWLNTLQCHKLEGEATRGRGTSLEEELLASLLRDIAPPTYTVQLTMSNQSMKNLSKKAKRKMANTMLNQSAIANHIPGEKNKDEVVDEDPEVVIAALKCLEVLLTVCGIFLKATVHKKVQDCLVRQCYALDSTCDSLRGLSLCRALEACRLSVPSNVAPPTHHCLHIYSCLSTSPHATVSQFCSQAVLSVRQVLHAAPPTLNYPPPSVEKEKIIEKPKLVVSERNRAALVALLGEDKMPANKKSEEVIVINDTASRKRKSDEDDKISLSSQSSNPVEIDESNGIDLDSSGPDVVDVEETDEPEETDEMDVPTSSLANGKMKLLDFDKKNKEHNNTIHELVTQIPQETSAQPVDQIDYESDHSIEISYDHSGRKEDTVKYLEKFDGDNLPSTGDTDDVQITCGQTMKYSQDSAKSTVENSANESKERNVTQESEQTDMEVADVTINGITEEEREVVINEDNKSKNTEEVTVDSTVKEGSINVEDMLADFVDEKA